MSIADKDMRDRMAPLGDPLSAVMPDGRVARFDVERGEVIFDAGQEAALSYTPCEMVEEIERRKRTQAVDTPDIDATLAERGSRYGDYAEHARITQAIKAAMADSPNWVALSPDMRETLEMIAHKVGRILNGDPTYHDSWHDIVGYTKLVADRLAPRDPA